MVFGTIAYDYLRLMLLIATKSSLDLKNWCPEIGSILTDFQTGQNGPYFRTPATNYNLTKKIKHL